MKVIILNTHEVETSDVLARELGRIQNWRAEGYRIAMDDNLCWFAMFETAEEAVMFKLTNELNKT